LLIPFCKKNYKHKFKAHKAEGKTFVLIAVGKNFVTSAKFTNILREAFVPISFCKKKLHAQTVCKKDAENAFGQKNLLVKCR